jgi:hypothetical protein
MTAALLARDAEALRSVAAERRANFPADIVKHARSALCLDGATTEGRADLIYLFEANVSNVTVVDRRADKLRVVSKTFPSVWRYLHASPVEVCKEALEGQTSFDVVIADGSRATVDNFWEDVLIGALALTRQQLVARITGDYLSEFDLEPTSSGVALLCRRLHGVDIDVAYLIKRSSGNGGTFWAIVNGAEQSDKAALGELWHKATRGGMDGSSGSYGSEHCVGLRDDLGRRGCPASRDCLETVDQFRRSLSEHERTGVFRAFTTPRFASLPRQRIDALKYASAIISLSRFSSMEEVWEAAKKTTSKRGNVNRMVARAARNHYFVKRFDRRLYVPDIYDVNTSTDTRGGKRMRENYLQTVDEMGGYPRERYDFEMPPCLWHAVIYWGVFVPEAGRMIGEVETGDRLVGYIRLFRSGNIATYSRILGHFDHLKNGIMYLLHFSIVEDLLGGLLPGLEYVRYGGMASRGEDGGLMRWKKRCLFEAKFEIYDEAGDWRGPNGMTYLLPPDQAA